MRILNTAVCLSLGLGIAAWAVPAGAQSAPAAADTGSGASTAQPPGASDLDTNFWVLVRDSADLNALHSYLSSFPSGKFTDEARQKIAALRAQEEKNARVMPEPSASVAPPAPAIAPIVPAPAAENKELARALQRELKRVGCLDAEADGVWGDKSRTALKEFARHANLSVGADEPNVALLDAAQSKRSRVCPLVCDDDEKVAGDRCVPNTASKPRQVRQKPAQEERRAPRRAWAERPAAEPRASSNSGKRICFGAGRGELVACP